MDLLGPYLDPELEERGRSLRNGFRQADEMIDHTSWTAVKWLYHWAADGPRFMEKWLLEALDTIARQLGVHRVQVFEASLPTYGFDGGRLELDYGARHVLLELDSTNKVRTYVDGKEKSLPKPLKGEGDDVARLRSDVTALKKDVRHVIRMIHKRLRSAIQWDHEWSVDLWRRTWGTNPLLANAARHVLWAVYDPYSTLVAFCRADGEGDLVTRDDQTLEPPPNATIRTAQWWTLTDRDRRVWSEVFGQYRLHCNPEQFELPEFSQDLRLTNALRVPPGDDLDELRARLRELGWSRPANESLACWAIKSFDDHGVVTVLGAERKSWGVAFARPTFRTSIDGPALDLGDVPPPVFREVAYDLEAVTGRPNSPMFW